MKGDGCKAIAVLEKSRSVMFSSNGAKLGFEEKLLQAADVAMQDLTLSVSLSVCGSLIPIPIIPAPCPLDALRFFHFRSILGPSIT